MSEKTRQAFENWAMDRNFDVGRFRHDGSLYDSPTTEILWASWQASRTQALEEAAKACEALKYNEGDAYANAYYDNALTDAASAIRREAEGK